MSAPPDAAASPDASAPRRHRTGWLAGPLTLVLVVGFGVLLGAPSGAALPRTTASTFVPADATRGKVTLEVDGDEVPAELSDARLPARAVPDAVSPPAYATVASAVRSDADLAWYREAVVPSEGSSPARYRWRTVDARGVWLVVQDWGDLGMTFEGLLELPADVAVGRTWTSSGTARARPADGELRFERTSTAAAPDDPARLAEGCLSVTSQTSISGARRTDWSETSLWCPGKGVVAGTGTFGDRLYAVTSGGAASPVTDADLSESTWDPIDAADWRLQTVPVEAGDTTFGLVDASTTGLLDPSRAPVVTAGGSVVFPTLEGGDLSGLVPDGTGLRADWWARPGGQVSGLAAAGSLVVAPTTAHRVSAYRAGRTLAWNAPLDDVAVAPPLVSGDTVLVGSVSGTLRALDARTGATRWTSAVGGGVHTPLAAGDGVVVTADTGSSVTAWDLATGQQHWQVGDAADPFATTLLVADGQVLVAAGGTVTAYALADGHRTWVREAGLGLDATTLVGQELWLGVDGRTEAWSVADGTSRWALPTAVPLTTAASHCDPADGVAPGLVRRGDGVALISATGGVVATWTLPDSAADVLTATCRGAGVDLTAHAADGSSPLTVYRLGSS